MPSSASSGTFIVNALLNLLSSSKASSLSSKASFKAMPSSSLLTSRLASSCASEPVFIILVESCTFLAHLTSEGVKALLKNLTSFFSFWTSRVNLISDSWLPFLSVSPSTFIITSKSSSSTSNGISNSISTLSLSSALMSNELDSSSMSSPSSMPSIVIVTCTSSISTSSASVKLLKSSIENLTFEPGFASSLIASPYYIFLSLLLSTFTSTSVISNLQFFPVVSVHLPTFTSPAAKTAGTINKAKNKPNITFSVFILHNLAI